MSWTFRSLNRQFYLGYCTCLGSVVMDQVNVLFACNYRAFYVFCLNCQSAAALSKTDITSNLCQNNAEAVNALACQTKPDKAPPLRARVECEGSVARISSYRIQKIGRARPRNSFDRLKVHLSYKTQATGRLHTLLYLNLTGPTQSIRWRVCLFIAVCWSLKRLSGIASRLVDHDVDVVPQRATQQVLLSARSDNSAIHTSANSVN